MTRWLGVLAALLLAGCTNLEDPAPSQQTRLVVHGMLDTQAGDQTVLIYRARTGRPNLVEGSGVSDDEPVSDAQVSLTGPDGFTSPADRLLTSSGDCCVPGRYLFATGPGGRRLKPGDSYTLRIRTPTGEEVTGTTTLPQGPTSLAVESVHTFLRHFDTLRLSWPRVAGAASYEVIIRQPRFGGEYRAFTDTSFTLAGNALTIAGDEIFVRGEDAEVFVSAVDVNYYDYYRSQSDPFAGAAPSHLTGAVGVFGSIAPIFHTLLLVR